MSLWRWWIGGAAGFYVYVLAMFNYVFVPFQLDVAAAEAETQARIAQTAPHAERLRAACLRRYLLKRRDPEWFDRIVVVTYFVWPPARRRSDELEDRCRVDEIAPRGGAPSG